MGLHVGIDIGIASVGWCVIDASEERIVRAGVRTFPKAENPKTGASLAEPRRSARSTRRRLKRRRVRMNELRSLLIESGVVSVESIGDAFVPQAGEPGPYELRAEGLDRRLTPREWARVLSQLCKRRGYRSMRLGEQKESDEGAVLSAIAANEARMEELGYRTAGEMLIKDERFAGSKRNKGDYQGVISRDLVLAEVAALFEAQRTFGNPHASPDLESRYVDILSWQAPIKEGDELASAVGRCSLDRTQSRIPAACSSFERFRILDKLHNVRFTIGSGGERKNLTDEDRRTVSAKAFDRASALTYADVRKLTDLPADARFIGVRYDPRNPDDLSPEKKERLPFPKAWYQMRKAVSGVSPDAWERLSSDFELLDRIGAVLTHFKLEESIRRELKALGLDEAMVSVLADLRFSGHGHLGRETILAILPHMEGGLPYPDACQAAGFHHSARAEGQRHAKLPAIPSDDVRNPVVLRALSQSRKVLNAIIDTYGPIEELHIEMARDVARSAEDRREIEKRQKNNRTANEAVLAELRDDYGVSNPRPLTVMKYKLWKEQGGHCPYSSAYIDSTRMLSEEPGVAEVDHILPHRRSFDDSYMNKVLATATENQRKRGKTPYEYLGGEPAEWHEFEERVLTMHLPRPKQERLLRINFDERAAEEFRERNLIDTQYTARFFKNFVEQNLAFAGDCKRPVVTVNGHATAYLRTGWQLQKVRADGDLHHALDAAVIAVTSPAMVQAVSRFFSVKPLRNHEGIYYDPSAGEVVEAKRVPEPWEGFSAQLRTLLEAHPADDPAALQDASVDAPTPILVSRMPSRTVRGEVHKETVRRIEGEALDGRALTSKRVRLEDLDLKTLERMVGRHSDRDLFELLRARLEAHSGDGTKAFAEPVLKPSRPNRPAPRVRSIRVFDEPSSGGTSVRGGLADNGDMVRTDVFERDGKHYLVPVYLKDVAASVLPMRAIVAFKAEKDWRELDHSYRFAFSLHLNDLVRLTKRKGGSVETWFGYYKGTDRSTGGIAIEAHDRAWSKRGLGVAQNIVAFEKYTVDVLGISAHRVNREKRLGFPNGHHQ